MVNLSVEQEQALNEFREWAVQRQLLDERFEQYMATVRERERETFYRQHEYESKAIATRVLGLRVPMSRLKEAYGRIAVENLKALLEGYLPKMQLDQGEKAPASKPRETEFFVVHKDGVPYLTVVDWPATVDANKGMLLNYADQEIKPGSGLLTGHVDDDRLPLQHELLNAELGRLVREALRDG